MKLIYVTSLLSLFAFTSAYAGESRQSILKPHNCDPAAKAVTNEIPGWGVADPIVAKCRTATPEAVPTVKSIEDPVAADDQKALSRHQQRVAQRNAARVSRHAHGSAAAKGNPKEANTDTPDVTTANPVAVAPSDEAKGHRASIRHPVPRKMKTASAQ